MDFTKKVTKCRYLHILETLYGKLVSFKYKGENFELNIKGESDFFPNEFNKHFVT